jgi:gliding motility-associated-like protein
MAVFLGIASSFAQTTYYSRNSAPQPQTWNLATSWTLNPDGSGPAAGPPQRIDDVIILNGHTIIISAANDNGSAGISPNGLSQANVGPFNGSGAVAFYHTGTIIVNEGGTLETQSTTKLMVAGSTLIFGDLVVSADVINLGELFMSSTSTFSSSDDLILSGFSTTKIDSLATTSDDLYMDFTDALLCGTGTLEIGLGPATDQIQFFNGATEAQICSTFTVTGCATVVGCPTCTSTCPSFTGTGNFTLNTPNPVLNGSGGTLNYIENSVTVIDPNITLTFAEPFLLLATASITNNFVDTEDVLALIPVPGVNAIYSSTTGVLILFGFVDPATWQLVLRNITYENLSDNPNTATRTVSFTITNILTTSNTITRDIAIIPVNDPPGVSTISGSPTPLAYTEGDGAIAVDTQITVADPDDVNLEGATVSLTNYVAGQDVLEFTDAFGVTKVGFDTITSILTLTGTATLANYELALRSVTYENTSGDPDPTTRTANFIVNDGDADSPPFARDIIITLVNDNPLVSGSITALAYTEGDGIVLLDNAIIVSDVDNVNLASATISFTANFQVLEDMLAFVDQNGITGIFATGVLTLTGSALVSDYQTALRSITYENTSEDPNPAIRTVSIIVNDGSLPSSPFDRDITVAPVNDAPVISGTLTALAYTEGDGAVLLDNAILVSDFDNTNIASATISITTNFQASEDVLVFVDQNGITGNYLSGVLTLAGSATLADYQTAIQSITYENTSDNPSPLTRTVSFIINDGTLGSVPFTRDIEITPVNDPPVVSGTITALAYTEGDGIVLLDNLLTVSDTDSPNLASATISFTANFQATEDVLAFTDQNGITGSFVGGVLTLAGSATLADYQTALRSVTYENVSEDPNPAPRTVSIGVNDSLLSSGLFDREIIITPVNDAPIVSGTLTALAYTEGDGAVLLDDQITTTDVDNSNIVSATISFTANYQAAEDVLTFVDQNGISSVFSAGVLTMTGSATLVDYQVALRSITYENTSQDPNSATRTVSFIINDGLVDSAPFDRDITVVPVNDPPLVIGTLTALLYTESDGAVILDNALAVSDIDNANLTSAIISITANYTSPEDVLAFTNQNGISGIYASGVLTLTGSSSLANYQTALQSITYENTNNNPNTSTRTVSININDGTDNSLPFDRDILITPVNDAPIVVATASALVYTEGDGIVLLDNLLTVSDTDSPNIASATVSFTANFQASEDVLAFANQNGITGNFSAGVLTLAGSATVADYQTALQSITYENASEDPSSTTRTVSFVVNDGSVNSLPSTRDITLMPVNDLPIVTGTSTPLAYTEGDGAVLLDNAITVADIDNTNLSSATVSISANFEAGEDVLAVANQNGITGSYSAGVLTLAGSSSLANYQSALRSVTYENTSIAPSTLNRTVEFILSDGIDNSLPFSRDIIITPIIEPPVLAPGGGSTITINYTEGDGAIALDPAFTIVDADDNNLEGAILTISNNYNTPEDVLAFSSQSGISTNFDATNGILTLQGTASLADYQTAIRTITYENNSESPSDLTRTILFTVNDGDTNSNEITITLNVTPVNDAPELAGTAGDLLYLEGSGLVIIDNTLLPTDIDNLELVGATIAISNNYQADEDVLDFSSQAGISGQFDAGTGILSLTGTATLSDYQAVLRTVAYENTSIEPDLSIRTVEYIINDGGLASLPLTRDILIEAVEGKVVVYQVVTPDGDSLNDTWVIDGIDQYPDNSVRIFNRWNSLVYKQSSYSSQQNGWAGEANEGMSNGELPDGTYFYTVNLGDGSDVLKGFLVLKRK